MATGGGGEEVVPFPAEVLLGIHARAGIGQDGLAGEMNDEAAHII